MFACLHAFDSGSDSGQMSLVYLFMRLIVSIIISVFAHSPAPCYHLLANKLSSSRRHYPSGSDGFLLPTHFSGLNHKTMHSKSKMITFYVKVLRTVGHIGPTYPPLCGSGAQLPSYHSHSQLRSLPRWISYFESI